MNKLFFLILILFNYPSFANEELHSNFFGIFLGDKVNNYSLLNKYEFNYSTDTEYPMNVYLIEPPIMNKKFKYYFVETGIMNNHIVHLEAYGSYANSYDCIAFVNELAGYLDTKYTNIKIKKDERYNEKFYINNNEEEIQLISPSSLNSIEANFGIGCYFDYKFPFDSRFKNQNVKNSEFIQELKDYSVLLRLYYKDIDESVKLHKQKIEYLTHSGKTLTGETLKGF